MPEEYLPVYLDCGKAESGLLLYEVWERLATEKLLRKLFYDGRIADFAAFRKALLGPGCLPFVVYGNGLPAMFTWLNHLEGKAARKHFVVFREFWAGKSGLPWAGSHMAICWGCAMSRAFFLTAFTGSRQNPTSWRLPRPWPRAGRDAASFPISVFWRRQINM